MFLDIEILARNRNLDIVEESTSINIEVKLDIETYKSQS